ncbi:MAG: hypothetical protein Tsb0013_20150 [Phycisphaerales bacterium]
MQTTITMGTLSIAMLAGTAVAGFDSYVIRNGGSGNAPGILPNNAYVPGGTEFVIDEGGMKAGLGSNDINGLTLGASSVSITRHDDSTRFNAGSGPATAPYFNIWVTDGMGNYAVLANEPSNPSFAAFRTDNGNGSFTYDFALSDIAAEPVQVYETVNGGYNSTNTWVHNLLGINAPLTFGDVLGLTIEAPSASYIANPANAVGSGAPDVLGTNAAYGFNWIFGDTLANYISGEEGYVVSGFSATPAPGAAALLGIGGLALARRRR